MKTLRMIAVILVVVMLFGGMIGCAADEPAKEETPREPSSEDATDSESENEVKPTVGLPAKNFGGEEFTILCRTEKNYEFDWELTGSNVHDAIYYRDCNIEEQYGVDLVGYQVDGNWANRQTFMDAIRKDASSGDNYIDMIAGYCAYMPTIVLDGYCTNLHDLALVNFDNDWWYDGFNKNMSINDKLYMAVGDASLTMWENLQVVYFNKDMLTDYSLEYPYEMVGDGTWDFATMKEYCLRHAGDIDDNGVMDISDNWGMLFYNKRDLMVYFENPYTQMDEDGRPYISVYSDRLVDIYDTIHDFMYGEELGYQFKPDELTPMFREGQTMFLQAPLRYAEIFRGNESDFGIVPFPKYDLSQENYYTPVVDDLSVFCVPLTVANEELTAYMMEVLNFESSQTVIPQFWDVSLTKKGFRDTESGEMLELVRDTIWFEFGFVYSQNCGTLGQILDCLNSPSNEITSYYKKNESAYQSGLDELIKFYYDE